MTADYFFSQVAPHTIRIKKLDLGRTHPEATYLFTTEPVPLCTCPGAFRAGKPQGCRHHGLVALWQKHGSNPWIYFDGAAQAMAWLPKLDSLRGLLEAAGLLELFRVAKVSPWLVERAEAQQEVIKSDAPLVHKLEDIGL